jgi:hypothetical protein
MQPMNSSTEEHLQQLSSPTIKTEEVLPISLQHNKHSIDTMNSICPSLDSNNGPSVKKRRLMEKCQPSLSSETVKKSKVSWNDDKNTVHLQDDPSQKYPTEYKVSDIWYSVRRVVFQINVLCRCIYQER